MIGLHGQHGWVVLVDHTRGRIVGALMVAKVAANTTSCANHRRRLSSRANAQLHTDGGRRVDDRIVALVVIVIGIGKCFWRIAGLADQFIC